MERHPYLRSVLGQLLRAPSWEGRHVDSCEEQKVLKALFFRAEGKSYPVCFAGADSLKPHRRPLILSELLWLSPFYREALTYWSPRLSEWPKGMQDGRNQRVVWRGRHWREASERGRGGKEKDASGGSLGPLPRPTNRPPALDGPSSQRPGQGRMVTSESQSRTCWPFPLQTAWEHMLLPAQTIRLPRACTLTSW